MFDYLLAYAAGLFFTDSLSTQLSRECGCWTASSHAWSKVMLGVAETRQRSSQLDGFNNLGLPHRLLGPLLGGTHDGSGGDAALSTLSSIVRAIAAGDVRRYLERIHQVCVFDSRQCLLFPPGFRLSAVGLKAAMAIQCSDEWNNSVVSCIFPPLSQGIVQPRPASDSPSIDQSPSAGSQPLPAVQRLQAQPLGGLLPPASLQQQAQHQKMYRQQQQLESAFSFDVFSSGCAPHHCCFAAAAFFPAVLTQGVHCLDNSGGG